MTPALAAAIDFAQEAYNKKAILGSQRALQFGGDQIFKHEARLYNCSFSYADRPAFFSVCLLVSHVISSLIKIADYYTHVFSHDYRTKIYELR